MATAASRRAKAPWAQNYLLWRPLAPWRGRSIPRATAIRPPPVQQKHLGLLGCWVIQTRIGGGAFGSVYSACNVITGREVAVKIEKIGVEPSLLRAETEVL